MIDKTLGSYRIVDKLGEGGMGEVWRAKDERLNRMVAIKILPPDMAKDAPRRARFAQEAKALAALNHPNILSIFDFGEDDGQVFIVSELVEGESLRAIIDRGPISARRAVDIAIQIAEGLAAAHSLNIVHRDLKPENVMVTSSGQVKLLDFGLAKQNTVEQDRTASMALSAPGTVMGTAGYMSPEQVRGEPVDTRSDIFSFGCVLYEMLRGKRAFKAPSGVETMHAILHADPEEFDDDVKLPPALGVIVRRCMEKQPGRRFQSAADLAFALRALNTNIGVSAMQPALPAEPEPRRRAWLWPALAALAAAALVAAGILLWDKFRRHEPVQYQRLTFRKGYVLRARFTPDAHSVVYSAAFDNGHLRNYLAIPGNPDSRDLELPDGMSLEAVSATQQLALLHDNTLNIASLSGGQPRAALDDVMAADWSPDGASMAVLRRVGINARIEYPIGTVLVDKIEWPQDMLRISPDGSRVVFATYASGSSIQLKVADKNGKITPLGVVSGQGTTGEDATLSWGPKGEEIWFRSFETAESGTVYAVDMKGHRRVALTLPARVKLYDVSRDGQVLIGTGTSTIGILGAGPGDAEERDLSCLDSGQVRAISDDGKLLVANVTGEAGGPKGAIYLRRMDGSVPVRIAAGHAFVLSPDKETVSGYIQDSRGLKRFLLFPTGPGEETEPHAPGLDMTIVVGWLGDRRYLAEGAYKGKKIQCFDWNTDSGSVKPLCPESATEPGIWLSPDRTLVLVREWGVGIKVYPVSGGPPQPVLGVGKENAIIGWNSDNRSVYVRPNRDDETLFRVSLVEVASGKVTPWKVLRPAQPVLEVHDLHISPGGAYAYNYVLANSDLYVARGVR
ncbi:MAG TPA: protein kinase [Bryobacteraceae bacterium]|nr:protein kinase [Bryobacteraceae bacterium]